MQVRPDPVLIFKQCHYSDRLSKHSDDSTHSDASESEVIEEITLYVSSLLFSFCDLC